MVLLSLITDRTICLLWFLFVVVLVTAQGSMRPQQRQRARERLTFLSNHKKEHRRGDLNFCPPVFKDRNSNSPPPPCRNNEGDNDEAFVPELPVGVLYYDVYVGISPESKTVGPGLTSLISTRWDGTLNNMEFFVGDSYTKFVDDEQQQDEEMLLDLNDNDDDNNNNNSNDGSRPTGGNLESRNNTFGNDGDERDGSWEDETNDGSRGEMNGNGGNVESRNDTNGDGDNEGGSSDGATNNGSQGGMIVTGGNRKNDREEDGGRGGTLGDENQADKNREQEPPNSNRHLLDENRLKQFAYNGNRPSHVDQGGMTHHTHDRKQLEDGESLPDRPFVFDLRHAQTISKLKNRYKLRWWWQITLIYRCFWDGGTDPVFSEVLSLIKENMTNALDGFQSPLNDDLQLVFQDNAIRFRTSEEGIPVAAVDDIDFDEIVTVSPTQQPSRPRREPLDASDWDFHNYFGLGLFLFTLFAAITLTLVGKRRRKLEEQNKYWGNLATADGVNKLLNTGWALDGGEMQIFDKTNVGYTDEDSVFLGGYEQREPVVGSEITVTHPETETTKDSNGVATLADTQSQERSTNDLSKY